MPNKLEIIIKERKNGKVLFSKEISNFQIVPDEDGAKTYCQDKEVPFKETLIIKIIKYFVD